MHSREPGRTVPIITSVWGRGIYTVVAQMARCVRLTLPYISGKLTPKRILSALAIALRSSSLG
eukprot:6060421-Pleurochrysis_carterae.AAC.1